MTYTPRYKRLNVSTQLRKTLYTYDVLIANNESKIKQNEIKMEMNANLRTKREKKAYTTAKIERDKARQHLNDLVGAKRALLREIDKILTKYTGAYKQIFEWYFIENKTIKQIAERLKRDKVTIARIIHRLKLEFDTHFFTEHKEQDKTD